MQNFLFIIVFILSIPIYSQNVNNNQTIDEVNSLANTENNLKIIIGKTDRKTIVDYLREPDNDFKISADGTMVTTETKKILFWKRTKTHISGTGYSVSRLAYKKYGICINFSRVASGEDQNTSKVTAIEIFDNKNLEGKRSTQNAWYYYGDFEPLEQAAMFKIFGKSFLKDDDDETETYKYTFTDKNLNFTFSKKDNQLLSLEIKK
ncbi:hypothetical protein [Flavobacterium quisquiliarum]|uniref:DUF4412 domain-containing protein n=1 Tax=Flavobacterium quisquiliarum TaxID=1834436 RepID=A0ABV8WE35_9FLAO|nr:hypothetical protein [Flavobacterium quisquiliarum]MBW1657943.1 hypothetical protein [Flavobacterium quisquiliarum]